jgi:NADPH-dependent curcumin reductase CurA
MRVVTSAGSSETCHILLELGADAAIDYKAPGSLEDKLRRAAPDEIDVYFDNVGGHHLDAAMAVAKQGARFAICGMIDMYNSAEPVGLSNLFSVISKRLAIRGFIVSDFQDRLPEFHAQMSRWLARGEIKSRHSIFYGLDAVPEAFFSLFNGGNIGKALVRL